MSGTEHLHDMLFNSSGEAMLMVDDSRGIVRANESFFRLARYGSDNVLGRALSTVIPDADDELWSSILEALEGGIHGWQGTVGVVLGDGETQSSELHVQRIPAARDREASFFLILRSLDRPLPGPEARPLQRDGLTGLPGTDLFRDRVEQAVQAALRENRPVALLLLGLDRFHLINDGLGSAVGDEVLKNIAGRLNECIRRSDTAARTRGDSFGLLTPITSDDHAVVVARKVLEAVRRPVKAGGEAVTVTGSIGITIVPADGRETVTLLNQAERALRHAKEDGGNRYTFFSSEMNTRARLRIEMENSLRKALEEEEFALLFQPKVDVQTERIVGAESLLRWNHPSRGVVSPMEFIPIAEETGLIVEIGAWILKAACRQNKQWQDEGLPPIPLAVNISGRQFQSSRLKEEVKEALEESGLAPKYLELEITESMLLTDIEKTMGLLQQLRDLNLTLAIDDFGTGYSNLKYLSRFPITTLKIDRAFVQGLEGDPGKAEITRAIIALSRGLKLEVVAEGAERREEVAFLKRNGCHTVQGFYYSRPVPAKEFGALLKAGHLRPRP